MAHRKAGGSASNLRDSNPKYLGTKLYDGQDTKPGSIIVRQRGTKIIAGENVKVGKDHTLYAMAVGTVKFDSKRKVGFNGKTKRLPRANVILTEEKVVKEKKVVAPKKVAEVAKTPKTTVKEKKVETKAKTTAKK